jgi:hypothetical protein
LCACSTNTPAKLESRYPDAAAPVDAAKDEIAVHGSDRSFFGGWSGGVLTLGKVDPGSRKAYSLQFTRDEAPSRRLTMLKLVFGGRSFNLLQYVPRGGVAVVERSTGTARSAAHPGFGVNIPIYLSEEIQAELKRRGESMGDGVDNDGCGKLGLRVDDSGHLASVYLTPAYEDICNL